MLSRADPAFDISTEHTLSRKINLPVSKAEEVVSRIKLFAFSDETFWAKFFGIDVGRKIGERHVFARIIECLGMKYPSYTSS